MSSTKNNRHPSKKTSGLRAELRQMDFPAELRIKQPDRLDEMQVLAEELAGLLDWFKKYYKKDVPEKDKEYLQLLQLLGEVCVGLWRTRSKLIDSNSGEPLEEIKRALRPLESTLDTLRQGGFEIKDRTNQPYVIGMLEKVVIWEPQAGLTREMIIETIRPTIIYQEMVLKQGEIVVGVPPMTDSA
jgi:hypothetical protein